MKRILFLALFAFTVISVPSKTNALEIPTVSEVSTLDIIKPTIPSSTENDKPKIEPEVIIVVARNDNLTKIAEAHKTTVDRLWRKNTSIADPNLLNVSQALVVPREDEVLAERPLPVTVISIGIEPVQTSAQIGRSSVSRGSSSGNTYSYGYCTWFVKNMRPDLPNNLGNADTWAARAAAQGLATGRTPRVGAVGQQGMHVVYITAVNGDGTVTLSEMNYKGWNVASIRTASASSFIYIY